MVIYIEASVVCIKSTDFDLISSLFFSDATYGFVVFCQLIKLIR